MIAKLLTTSLENFFKIVLRYVALVVRVEVVERKSKVCFRKYMFLANSGCQEFRIIDLTVLVKVKFRKHLVNDLNNQLLVVVGNIVVELDDVLQLLFVDFARVCHVHHAERVP